MNRRVDDARTTGTILVLDIPLLTENPRKGLQGKIVVDVPPDVQVERLVRYRGFSEDDARARISKQASREERLKDADFVVDNSGDVEDLDPMITRRVLRERHLAR
jgi:dephospho-CoA kinase